MNLGLFRREHMQSGNPELIGSATVDQFQRTHGAIGAWTEVEHDDAGRHTDITARSIDLGPAGHWDARGNFVATGPTQQLGEFVFESGAGATGEQMTVGLPNTDAWRLRRQPASSPLSGQQWSLWDLANPNFPVERIGYYVPMGGYVLIPSAQFPVAHGFKDGNSFDRLKYVAVQDGIYEQGRVQAMGYWTPVPFFASNFAGNLGMTVSVDAADVSVNAYTLVGKTLTWSLTLSAFTTGAAAGQLVLTLPGGFIAARTSNTCAVVTIATGGGPSTTNAAVSSTLGSSTLIVAPLPSFVWGLGVNDNNCWMTAILEIQ